GLVGMEGSLDDRRGLGDGGVADGAAAHRQDHAHTERPHFENLGPGMGFASLREVLRTVAMVLTAIVALVLVGWAGLRLWVGSNAGHQVVERKVDESVAEHAGGHVRLGAISGSLVAGATVDGVEWRDDAGAVVLRARKLVARWSAAKAIAKRPELELRV